MSSAAPAVSVLLGRQAPRVLTIPASAVGSRVDDALALWDLTGRRLDEWQETSCEALFAVDRNENWAASEAGILVSRQQGKGEILQVYDLAHLYLWPKPDGEPKVILHTAHEFATVDAHYRKLKRRIMGTPWLRRQLKGGGVESARGISGISTGMGRRIFELENGNLLVLQTRTGSAGVGLTVDVLGVDEAQESPAETMEALLFTQDGVANTQVLYTGTVPMPHQSGEHFEGVRDRGRAGTFPRTTWVEFSPDGSDDPDIAETLPIDSREVWAQSSPALGVRTTEADIEDKYNALHRTNPDAFIKQRLSIWPNRRPDAVESPNDVDMAAWAAGGCATRVGVGAVLSVSLGRGGGYSSLGAAWRLDDGRILVQHMATQAGTLWVADRLRELREELRSPPVVLDERNCAPILSDLERARIPVQRMATIEVGGAREMFVELVNARLVAHPGQDELTTSLKHATTRPMGSSRLLTWEQSNPLEPITQVQAATLALWGLKRREARPRSAAPLLPAVLGQATSGSPVPRMHI